MRKDMDKITVKRLSCITLIIMGFGGLLLAVSEICGGFYCMLEIGKIR